ncbi:PREDICTED: uncharacterized protein LOC105965757 [Erythranthe guttata]|uniref:uncharacterized protein LOC105965757 n=1 Tax=Erythranthe guttata TaxID=4155 RepID=UPI00064E1306|nr:PREDICTED: uncharacterized protein LOC105965757 [Erythranthe guttata]|eukprot:XP_012845774.1 PREDICTED: uncharacterized protein LOC105965757 [Erythranthe guttata]
MQHYGYHSAHGASQLWRAPYRQPSILGSAPNTSGHPSTPAAQAYFTGPPEPYTGHSAPTQVHPLQQPCHNSNSSINNCNSSNVVDLANRLNTVTLQQPTESQWFMDSGATSHMAPHSGYRCLDRSTGRIIIFRHVSFDETHFPFAESTAPINTLPTSALDENTPSMFLIPQTSSNCCNSSSNCFNSEPPCSSRSSNRPITQPTPVPPAAPPLDHDQLTSPSPTPTSPSPTPPPLPAHPMKLKSDGSLERYKARWVVRGFHQQAGIDFDETFSPVVKPATQPPGFVDPSRPTHVCRLNKALYGLKQAPRAWYKRFASHITTMGFRECKFDTSLFVYCRNSSRDCRNSSCSYPLLYVDDIVLTASTPELLHSIITALNKEFAMKDLGDLHYFLGISVTRSSNGLFLSQRKYADEILERAYMASCNPCLKPADTNVRAL